MKRFFAFIFCIGFIHFVSLANEQVLTPVLDGYIRQYQDDFISNLSNAELKKHSSFGREIYLDFDFSVDSINAQSAWLRIYCESFDKYAEPTISVYALQDYHTDGLRWTTRPTLANALTSVSINQLEHSSTWVEWNITSFLSTLKALQSGKVTIVVVLTTGNDALLKFAMTESPVNKPYILLSDEASDPIENDDSVIKMPTVFCDYMVLQRDKPIKVWGEVLPNKEVIISFDEVSYATQCDQDGKFSTYLPAKSASDTSYSMHIIAAEDTLTIHKLVMGDVYLCAGQSNMAFKVGMVTPEQLANAQADATYPNLRFFEIAKVVNGGVLTGDDDKPWRSAIPQRVVDWSALAFFFGRDLHKHLNIPIGLINCSHGGAPSDAFISPEAYANDPELNAAKRPDGIGLYQYYQTPSSLYHSMVSKVVGYPIKGVLWYQGEANAVYYWQSYKTIFKGLIQDWRTQWDDPALPWLFVQLPAYEPTNDPSSITWAETRDIQLQCWKEDDRTGMVVTMDCGEADDIHPSDKYTVAQRLLPYARSLIYGEELIHKSPVYKSHEVVESDMYVTFDNVGGGLIATKAITEFEIAGADGIYKEASAILLSDNRIKLSESTISVPVYVRYAFKNFTSISIYTLDELPLPLSPFKTEYPEITVEANEIPFARIDSAYASSTYTGRLPLYAINGAGLMSGTTHEAVITAKAWHTNDIPFPHYFKMEMKTPEDIAAMRIWNLNWWANYLNRGVNDIEIYVSSSSNAIDEVPFSDAVWKKVMNYSMSEATGDGTYTGEMLVFPSVEQHVKWVGINILNSHNNTNGYTGISEIKLYSSNGLTSVQPLTENKLVSAFMQKEVLFIEAVEVGSIYFSIYSIQGVKCFSQEINQSPFLFSTNSLSRGCYILHFTNGVSSQLVKVVV